MNDRALFRSGSLCHRAHRPAWARARAQGKRLGRPEITPSLVQDMKTLRKDGHSLRVIADRLGVGRGTVEKYTKGVESQYKEVK